MAELVACLHHGKLEVLRRNANATAVESPQLTRLTATHSAKSPPRIASVTRGRTSGELCYALWNGDACDVFAQSPGSGQEQRLFHGVEAQLSELDFSPADEALACTVAGTNGTSAIGVLADDGKGLRTVTEGDVMDRAPRWAPGGRGEIVYASAGIGRSKSGKAVGRSPFSLHRLRFSDNSVEVLVSDAQYDYPAVVPASQDVLYALRRTFDGASKGSPFASLAAFLRNVLTSSAQRQHESMQTHDLVRVTSKGSQLIAHNVFAFDVSESEDVVYASEAGVFRVASGVTTAEQLSTLSDVRELVVYW
jgi:hypothetical protein